MAIVLIKRNVSPYIVTLSIFHLVDWKRKMYIFQLARARNRNGRIIAW